MAILDDILEAEKRGLEIPQDKQDLLQEARSRGLIESLESDTVQDEFGLGGFVTQQKERREFTKETISNIPSSASEFSSNIIQAISSPFETGKAVGKLALGTIELAIPGEQGEEQFARALGDFFKERFGSREKMSETIKNDPVGTLSDLSVVIGGLGGVLKIAGKSVNTANKVNVATEIGKTLSKVSKEIEPIGIVGGAVGKVAQARRPVNSLIKTAFQFNPKGSPAEKLARIDELAQVVLDTPGITISRKAIANINAKRKVINNRINKIIDDAHEKGFLSTQKIVDNIDDLIDESRKGGLENVGIRKMERLKEEFINTQGSFMSPRDLQSLKKGLNQAFKPDTKGTFEAVIGQVRKARRQGAREIIESINPELKVLNANDGVFNEINKAINTRLIALEQQGIVASKGLAAGAVGGALAGSEAVTVGQTVKFGIGASLFSKIVDSPKLQVAIAKALSKARLTIAKSGKLQEGTRPAFQAGRIESQLQPQFLK